MSFAETVLLGALAGFTIFLGLPFGAAPDHRVRARGSALAMFAVGVLAFLFVDIFEHALEIVEEPVEAFKDGEQGIGEAIGLVALLGAGFAAGDRRAGDARALDATAANGRPPPIAGGAVDALTVEDAERLTREAERARRRALQSG